MTNREAIETIKALIGCIEWDFPLDYCEALDMAIKALANDINVPTKSKWISVKDRLPENNRFVLVCNDDGHMLVAQYIEETAQWQYKYTNYDVDVWDDEEQGPVCWWAELPEPPKEGDERV